MEDIGTIALIDWGSSRGVLGLEFKDTLAGVVLSSAWNCGITRSLY